MIVSLVLGGHQKVPDNVSFLEMNLYSNFITDILKTYTEPFSIGANFVDVIGVGGVVISPVVDHGLFSAHVG